MAKRKKADSIYIDIIMKRKSLRGSFSKLKYENSISDAEEIFVKLVKSTTKTRMDFEHIMFPETYGQLRVERLVYRKNCKLERELAWGKMVLASCGEKICAFQKCRRAFENLILLGRYEKAEKDLLDIKRKFGCSLWSMEQEFLLCELQYGLEANKKFQHELDLQLNEPWVSGFADFFSLKAERNLNEGQYILRINRRLRNLDDAAKIYFKMHLLMEVEVEKIDWQQVLGYAAGSSVIDYYLDYCKICSYIICDSEITKERKDYVRKLLEELKRDIQDPLLEKIAFNGDYFELSEIEHSIQDIGVHYTEGRYQEVIDECREWLQRRSNIFEIYVYYIKACIISGNVSEFLSHKEDVSYLDSDSNPCIRDALLDILYAVYQKKPGCESAFDEIRILMRYLNGFFIAPELYNFYLKKVAYYFSDFWKKSLEYQAQYHNTRSCFLYENELRQKYLDVFKENCGESSILELYKIAPLDQDRKMNGSIEPLRLQWYRIKQWAEEQKYSQALQAATDLGKSSELYVREYLREDLPLFVFEMKVKLGSYLAALEMLVDIYMENRYMAMRINKKKFFDMVKNNITDEIKENIAMPILSYIVSDENSSKVFIDYANFMNKNGFMKVKDLLDRYSDIDKKRLIFFLRYVCTVDILDTMYWAFNTQEEVLAERIFICQTLRNMDPNNEKVYNDEIGNITQRQNLSSDIRYLEEQKIDFDMEKIHNNYLTQFLGNFKRYKEIGQIWQDIQGINVVREDNLVIYTYILDENTGENYSADKRNQKFDMFSELFYELRDEAAFGQMGLDQSLGTRIRHGRLQNQIRHVFEQKNMIFIKKDDNRQEYIPVNEDAFEMLFDVRKMESKQVITLKRIITEFTKAIDIIVTEVNKDYIRIKTEKDYPKGIIDMKYTSNDVFELFVQGADYENAEMMLELFGKTLLSRIRKGLNDLRELFRNQIKERYVKELNILEKKLCAFYKEVDLESSYTKVHSNLTQCRTEVQRELETISQWFRLPTFQEHPDYCMKDLLATCRATMRNINARYDQATIKIEDQTCSYWLGRTFSYFNEILVILFNNAFNHTGYKQELEKLEIGLKLIEDERSLRLNMMTNLSDELDIEEIQTKTREIREKLRQYTYTNRAYSKDSGSGYIKIMNMLHNYIAPQDYIWMNFGVETDKQHFFTDIIIEKLNITGEEKIEVIAD